MYLFIINPIAGSGLAKKRYKQLKKTASYRKMEKQIYFTQYHGHAEELMKQLPLHQDIKDVEGIVVIGGDGTIHEVINGLGNMKLPITYIPGGSGNDFARGGSILQPPEEILDDLYKNKGVATYWLGRFQTDQQPIKIFVNCLGIGFDAAVAKRANQSSFKKLCNRLHIGKVVYMIALIRELFSFTPVSLTVHIDGKVHRFHQCLLLTINNHPFFGGGMKINPFAVNNKETLSLLVIDSISKWKVLALFATVFTGKHLTYKEVNVLEGEEITIISDKPFPFQVDGETSESNKLHVSKHPDTLKITSSSM